MGDRISDNPAFMNMVEQLEERAEQWEYLLLEQNYSCQ